jgi:TRAP-type C4-dicarboxylate transport system substrate-binding protein
MEFVYPTEEELEAFRKASESIYEAYEDVWGKELLDAFKN